MPDIPEALQVQLSGGDTRLAWVWILTRRDGTRFGFTDHDQALTVNGVSCDPESGFESGNLRAEAGGSPAQGVVFGVFNSPAITEADLNAGLWDGARVHVYRVDSPKLPPQDHSLTKVRFPSPCKHPKRWTG